MVDGSLYHSKIPSHFVTGQVNSLPSLAAGALFFCRAKNDSMLACFAFFADRFPSSTASLSFAPFLRKSWWVLELLWFFHLPLSENAFLILIRDLHNAQIKYTPQDENVVASSTFFNLEGQEFVSVTSDFQSWLCSLLVENTTWCSDNESRKREVSWCSGCVHVRFFLVYGRSFWKCADVVPLHANSKCKLKQPSPLMSFCEYDRSKNQHYKKNIQ